MAKVIHHYPLSPNGLGMHPVPEGTRVLSVAMRRNIQPAIYVEKDAYATGYERQLQYICAGTGLAFDNLNQMPFIGTITDGLLIWHVYARVV